MQTASDHAARRSAMTVESILWVGVIALTGIIVINSLPYFNGRLEHAFLIEKGTLALQPAYRTAFILHVAGAILCLSVGPLLFSRKLLRSQPRAHRYLGRMYALMVLVWAAPSGAYLAVFAKGGIWGQSNFMLLAIMWWIATFFGVRRAMRREIASHRRWMRRSYALATTAITFRLMHLILYFAAVPDHANYIASLWSTFALTIVLVEIVNHRDGARRSVLIRSNDGRHPNPRSRSERTLLRDGTPWSSTV
ncbi:MAG: DUF2306 domain-containing protein [Planctomycetota bacterium]